MFNREAGILLPKAQRLTRPSGEPAYSADLGEREGASVQTAFPDFVERVARVGVVLGTAILLTFCRGLMLAAAAQPTPLDTMLNGFVLLLAPLCALYSLRGGVVFSWLWRLSPALLLLLWVAFCLVAFTPGRYWPEHSPLISILLALLIASQIARAELRLLRRCILFLATLFTAVVLLLNPGLLASALSGGANERLGIEISPANVLIMPRVYYTLVFTCFATILIERKPRWHAVAVASLAVPAVMGFSGGSRGPLLALTVALLVFAAGAFRQRKIIKTLTFTVALSLIGYRAILALFPTIVRRVGEDDTLRVTFYEQTLDKLFSTFSVVGQGKGDMYEHNIFLEFAQDYGLIGFIFFLLFLAIGFSTIWRVYRRTRDIEVLWAIGIVLIQFLAQQFSLDIYVGSLWAALLLPFGLRCREQNSLEEKGFHASARTGGRAGLANRNARQRQLPVPGGNSSRVRSASDLGR